ncbi:MAG: ketoacyl-ACP synthase III [Deltaproteobacteria bacterium]|nr:ketoacyl-ACP synthase III [Deltaproteobacteria bacterium]
MSTIASDPKASVPTNVSAGKIRHAVGRPAETPYYTRISGTGSYLPEKVLSNTDLEKMVETNDAWIVERTGIKRRHIAAEGQFTSDIGLIASQRALEAAGLSAQDIDMIIFCTVSGDQPTPSTACVLQHKLGARNVMSFDLNAACSGFVYGLGIADQFIRTGLYKHVLVVGAEVLHPFVNYKDRETCILFGDGAGAVIASRAEPKSDSKVYSVHMRADGSLGELFMLKAGGSAIPMSVEAIESGFNFLSMKGREIFKHAVRTMSDVCQEALDANGLVMDQIQWLIPHQANLRIIDAVGKHFGIPAEKVVINVDETGNTSAATVPIAFDEAIRDGRIKRGDNVLLTAFGSGLTSGSLLLKF